MQVVILAAGPGTRMRPLTNTRSKSMIPVAGRPFLEWQLSFLDAFDEIIIVANKKQKDLIEFLECRKNVKIVYQDKPLGTAHALAQAEKLVSGKFLMMNGDELFPKKDIVAIAEKEPYTVAVFPVEHVERFAAVLVEDGLIKDILEKQSHPDTNLARCGMDILDERVFDAIRKIGKSPRGEYELPDAYRVLRNEGVKSYAFEVSDWVSISYPWNILDANKFILDEFGSQIGKCEIRSGAVIEEPVAIGDGSVIGPNCFIRKYSSIGKNCKIGQAVEIKNSIIMDNTFVSHLSYVGDSIIGSNCNIGGGAMFANLRLDEKNVKMEVNGLRVDSGRRKLGGIVGDNVKLGVNVTVMPGKRIWNNLLVPPCITVTEDIREQIALSNRS
jgi:bifunctional UDP-N-acetylglucosamine pyrophosphorylase/glucosamine-1-phosphate N-acetyltransferase